MILYKDKGEVYAGETLVATTVDYGDSVIVEPTPACTIGEYLATLTLLKDKGSKTIYERKPIYQNHRASNRPFF